MGALLLPVALTLARWGGSCRPVRIFSVTLSIQIHRKCKARERENKIKKSTYMINPITPPPYWGMY